MIVTAEASKMIEPLMNDLIRKNSDQEQVQFIIDHVSYWNFMAGERNHDVSTPYYMCVNHALKRICTARFAMFLHDDRTFKLPQDFILNSIKYMNLRDDVHGLTTNAVENFIYRTSLHIETGYLSEERINLLEVLQSYSESNIVSYDNVEEELEELEKATDDDIQEEEREPNDYDEEEKEQEDDQEDEQEDEQEDAQEDDQEDAEQQEKSLSKKLQNMKINE